MRCTLISPVGQPDQAACLAIVGWLAADAVLLAYVVLPVAFYAIGLREVGHQAALRGIAGSAFQAFFGRLPSRQAAASRAITCHSGTSRVNVTPRSSEDMAECRFPESLTWGF
jgi:hypothetical protein